MRLVRSLRARGAERGAAAVEFALLLPLMFLVIAGIVDFGRAFFTQIELTNAAREGARAAVVSSISAGDIQARAAASAPGIGGLSVDTPTICPASGGGNATVTARATFDWILLQPALSMVGAGAALPTSLSSTAVMKCGG
ncbi:MAG: pilus assembly protein [Intrasporangium sp.]|uniref:TadE family protein n=1 Tax=Intrasporangium sp. TaxID=1925024 RepID=UPI002649C65C|nr:TadE family protein [Intrasporangium sp.]MDN5795024.1 pilus assembly protein [Intrasporangium sp.]